MASTHNMDDLKTKTVMVIDNGLFVSFARMLGKEFKKVYYYNPWQSAFVQSKNLCVGQGFDEIERVLKPLSLIDEVDLWVFLDLYQSDLQLHLEKLGCRVWGARSGEDMELQRWEFKQYLKSIGLPVQHIEHVFGFEDLRRLLKSTKNKFVKTSFTRGDFETFRHDSYMLSEPRLDDLEHSAGALKTEAEFIVEDEIPEAVEVGYDGYTVDGQFPSHAMQAIEVKDSGMIGVAKSYDTLARPVRDVNTALRSELAKHRYRGFYCTEIRYTKGKKPYFIDPCCRLGTPSNELLQELFDGWGEVLWHGAAGQLKSPRVKARFGVLAVVHSEFAVNDWQALHYPKELDQFVKLRFHTRIQDKDYVVPQVIGIPDVGVVVGTGKTLLEAVAQCKERAAQIKGFQVSVSLDSIDKGLEEIKKGEALGIKFCEEALPTAEQVRKT